MTNLLQQIKNDQLVARKARATAISSLLTTLIGEASMPGKNDGNRDSTDAEVLAVVKKFVKNLNEVVKVTEVGSDKQNEALDEIVILDVYLPKQLDETELRQAISSIISTLDDTSMKAMGLVMKNLKETYNGNYDGKLASTLTKEILSNIGS